jgi:hypothetical protein
MRTLKENQTPGERDPGREEMKTKKTLRRSRRKRRKNQEDWRQGVWRIPSLFDAVPINDQRRMIVEKTRRSQPLMA